MFCVSIEELNKTALQADKTEPVKILSLSDTLAICLLTTDS